VYHVGTNARSRKDGASIFETIVVIVWMRKRHTLQDMFCMVFDLRLGYADVSKVPSDR
jgi:hypothetical protein